MRMTSTQITCLARLVSDLRVEWDFHGARAAVEKLAQVESNFTACQIALNAAADPTCRTPGPMVTNPIYRPDRPTAAAAAHAAPSAGRENAERLRRETAEAAAHAATPEQIAAIRAAAGRPRVTA